MTHSLWLSLLGLGVLSKDQTRHQSGFLPALGPEAGQFKSQGTLRSVSACFHLPAVSHAQSLKETVAVFELHKVGSQQVTR